MKSFELYHKLYPRKSTITMGCVKIVICLIWLLGSVIEVEAQNQENRDKSIVVVLSLDAFRWDLAAEAHTPTLDSLRKSGSYTETYPCFPANTFPNHYAMATGLHPNHNGIVNNSFYDKELKRTFSMGDSASIADPVFWKGEPIWTTAEKQGVRSSVFFWVGSETNTHKPSVWKPFDSKVTFKNRADSVLSWLSLPEDQMPRLIMWYLEEPDAIAHKYGPKSPQVRQKVEHIDSLLGYFFSEVKKVAPYERINFIITADHGMTELAPERYVNLYTILDSTKISKVAFGNPLQINFSADYEKTAYKILKKIPNITVWKRDKMPSKYNYGSDTMRIERIIIQPHMGYKVDYRSTDRPGSGGAHGYDPFGSDMRMVFYASGPAFKVGYEAKSFQNLNLYELISHLLGITPAPNDGNLKSVKKMLKK